MIDEQAVRSVLASGMHMVAEEYRDHIAKNPEVTYFVMCNAMVIASPESNPNGWWSRAWHVLVVSHDYRADCVRIISAREATPRERRFYESKASH